MRRRNRTSLSFDRKCSQSQPTDLLYAVAQPFALKGALHQSLTVGLGFDLLSGQVQPAAQVIGAAMQSLAPGDCLDMGLPKPTAEWLLAGSALTMGLGNKD
ncbi:MAG: hypothetical protein LBU43_09665 [Candidatus Accumulibacter sp.]|nr:hypothetical protein [Accumulibacter sp.]